MERRSKIWKLMDRLYVIVNIKKIEMVTTLSGSHHLKIMGTI